MEIKSNNRQLTLGSLFDGSGGFPFAGILAGIKPVWSSEIEPFAIRVTTKRLPDVKHYGDVSALSGADLEPVDIITFGSPCQDLSIAGKRSGLDGSRSGLFFEAIRIVKEMREKTNGEKPRFIVWENVPGAFSSNKGGDFKAVLEEIIRIKEPEAPPVPPPEKGKWPYADCYLGDGWGLAYRVLDAQYWSVPQRRARIFLVADFAGERAPEILFKSEGVSGYSAESFRERKGVAGNLKESTGAAGRADEKGRVILNDQGGSRMDVSKDVVSTLRAEAHHPPVVLDGGEPAAAGFCTEHSANARSIGYEEEISPTLRAGVVPAAIALDYHPADSRIGIGEPEKIQTLTSRMGTGGNNVPLIMDSQPTAEGELPPRTLKIRSGYEGGGKGILVQTDKSATLGCNNDQTVFVPYGVCSKHSHSMLSDNPNSGFYEADTARTLDQNCCRPDCSQGGIAIVEVKPEAYDVRFTSDGTKNARGHCYKTDISRCLDTSEANPDSNHGGVCVVEGGKQEDLVPAVAFTQNQRNEVRDLNDVAGALAAEPGMKQQTYVLQGSMIGRSDRNGPQGEGVNENVSFALDTSDRHAVAYCMTTGSFMQVHEERAPTLATRDFKAPPMVNEMPYYIVRRLTPTECARLQGFPDTWCADLGTENPTDEEIAFWTDVFETHRKVVTGAKKPKTEKRIRKWLADPYSDSAEYRLWGNGIALPCAFFVLSGIVWAAGLEEE